MQKANKRGENLDRQNNPRTEPIDSSTRGKGTPSFDAVLYCFLYCYQNVSKIRPNLEVHDRANQHCFVRRFRMRIGYLRALHLSAHRDSSMILRAYQISLIQLADHKASANASRITATASPVCECCPGACLSRPSSLLPGQATAPFGATGASFQWREMSEP